MSYLCSVRKRNGKRFQVSNFKGFFDMFKQIKSPIFAKVQRYDNVRDEREMDADLSKTVKTAFFPDEYPAKVESLASGASSTSRNKRRYCRKTIKYLRL